LRDPTPRREAVIELFLDRANPLHWAAVAVLAVSGLACAWIGVRDGFVRGTMRTNSGVLRGRAAVLGGLAYLVTGAAGLAGALWFLIRARP
jgi:hypothetical protein